MIRSVKLTRYSLSPTREFLAGNDGPMSTDFACIASRTYGRHDMITLINAAIESTRELTRDLKVNLTLPKTTFLSGIQVVEVPKCGVWVAHAHETPILFAP